MASQLFIRSILILTTFRPLSFVIGPKWYPFLGSGNVVRTLAKKHNSQWKAFYELSKQYSTNVLGLKLGGENYVVVYGEKNLQQAFSALEFDGRPNSFFIKLRCLGEKMGKL